MKWHINHSDRSSKDRRAEPHVEVVIYAHSPVNILRACVDSALRSFPGRDFLIVKEAEQNHDVACLLEKFASTHGAVMIENFDHLGYWRSVVKGIDRARADYLVVLDGTAVAARNSLRQMVEYLDGDEALDVVVPLTSQHLSASLARARISDPVACRFAAAANAELLATALENSALSGEFIRSTSPFAGYSAFAIRRSAFSKLASWRHASSAGSSRSEPICIGLAAGSYVTGCSLELTAGNDPLWDAFAAPSWPAAMEDFAGVASAAAALERVLGKTVLFLLSDSTGVGLGLDPVPLEIIGLRDCGIRVHAAIGSAGRHRLDQEFPELSDVLTASDDEGQLVELATRFDTVIATDAHSSRILMAAHRKVPGMRPMYYLQDYEPWSLSDESCRAAAEQSFAKAAQMGVFARSQWLCRTMWQRHRIKADRVATGLDRSLFNRLGTPCADPSRPLVIVSPIRTRVSSGNAKSALRILRTIAIKHGARVDIRVFGCTDEELDEIEEAQGFELRCLSGLKRRQMGNVLREADIFADLSTYRATGQLGLEAMAAGCAAILPAEGATREFASDGEDSLVVDTTNESDVLAAFERLITGRDTLARLQERAIRTGRCNSMRKTIWSELLLLSGGTDGAES